MKNCYHIYENYAVFDYLHKHDLIIKYDSEILLISPFPRNNDIINIES